MIIRLSEFFEEDLFISELKAKDKVGALKEMTEALVNSKRLKHGEGLYEMLQQRESLGSTGIGRGVAVPHGRTLAISRLTVIFARSEAGVEFDSMDGKPVHLLFMTVAPPQERANLYLPVLGKIVETVKSAKTRRQLLKASDFDEITEILEEADEGA
ncbi:MAG: PTS sugar transporter subunit IIA [Candidatus Eisenbacteria bacterium]|uniref:PTS sugar transporter subunit IIA n=1 Tax=Eiseniibacteriota bacterium TaxID=2212470 RepID=A0A7Y2E966_UNCEI|nr:PTS sugar transporter subunit IIA [Candidatus Eisenbacteria bacterium]